MNKCKDCKYKGHCDQTSDLYGVPRYSGGCKLFTPKEIEENKNLNNRKENNNELGY